jgi:hypothetical protein
MGRVQDGHRDLMAWGGRDRGQVPVSPCRRLGAPHPDQIASISSLLSPPRTHHVLLHHEVTLVAVGALDARHELADELDVVLAREHGGGADQLREGVGLLDLGPGAPLPPSTS